MKNTHYTEGQMQAAYHEWQQSGLSKKDYCLKNNLSRSSFFYWIKKLENKVNSSTKGFEQIKIADNKAFGNFQSPQIEIEYPSGMKIKVYHQADASWIKTII